MEKFFENIATKILQRIEPELAHDIALKSLKSGLYFRQNYFSSTRLQTTLAGLELSNPIGLAAGFDKNAEVIGPLSKFGFGFIEVGAVTPLPQKGNPKPRIFRIKEENAILNHLGFNNQGMKKINRRLKTRNKKNLVGLNLGANKNSDNKLKDFSTVLAYCGDNIDFATINLSSPNTTNLRDLQKDLPLNFILKDVNRTNLSLKNPIPIFLKISPELKEKELEGIVDIGLRNNISGIIATNTSTNFDNISKKYSNIPGGLSGPPVFDLSTRVLSQLSVISAGKIPLIGVGGVSNAKQAFIKITAGASAIQLYTALAFKGPGLVMQILKDLDLILKCHGFDNISQAVGVYKDRFF